MGMSSAATVQCIAANRVAVQAGRRKFDVDAIHLVDDVAIDVATGGLANSLEKQCLGIATVIQVIDESRVKRTYQRHSYEAEKRDAWRLLGERLDLLTRPDAGNVVLLDRIRNTA